MQHGVSGCGGLIASLWLVAALRLSDCRLMTLRAASYCAVHDRPQPQLLLPRAHLQSGIPVCLKPCGPRLCQRHQCCFEDKVGRHCWEMTIIIESRRRRLPALLGAKVGATDQHAGGRAAAQVAALLPPDAASPPIPRAHPSPCPPPCSLGGTTA